MLVPINNIFHSLLFLLMLTVFSFSLQYLISYVPQSLKFLRQCMYFHLGMIGFQTGNNCLLLNNMFHPLLIEYVYFVFLELGVFAKKPIPKYTQFGPFVGDLVDSQEKVTVHKFPLMVRCIIK